MGERITYDQASTTGAGAPPKRRARLAYDEAQELVTLASVRPAAPPASAPDRRSRGVVQGLKQAPVRAAEGLASFYDVAGRVGRALPFPFGSRGTGVDLDTAYDVNMRPIEPVYETTEEQAAGMTHGSGAPFAGERKLLGWVDRDTGRPAIPHPTVNRSFAEGAGTGVASLYGDDYVPPEELTPGGRRAMVFGGEALAGAATLGAAGASRGAVGLSSLAGPRAARTAARLGEVVRSGAAGLAADEVGRTDFAREHPLLGMGAAVGAGAATSQGVGALTAVGRRGAAALGPRVLGTRLPMSRLEFASRLGVTPLAHEADDVLDARLGRARGALDEQLALERGRPELGTATTARTLAEAGFPGAESLERSQALAYPTLGTTLGEQNLANRDALAALESTGGAPAAVPRGTRAASKAIGEATDEAYQAFRDLPDAPRIATQPVDDAYRAIYADTQRGKGVLAGSARGLDEIVASVEPQSSLDDLEAVRTRLRVELDKNSPGGVVSDPQRQRYLMQLRQGIDDSIDQAARGSDAVGALKDARRARRLEGYLTDAEHDATRILRDKGYDVDAMTQNLMRQDPKELARVVALLQQTPDAALRESSLAGLEELWLRNLKGRKGLSELTPADARDLAARLRDSKNDVLARQARIIFSGRLRSGQAVRARVEEVAQILERIPLLESPQGNAGAAYRTGTGIGSDVFSEANRGGVSLRAMGGAVWERLRNRASGMIDEDLNRALTDKAFASDLLRGITPEDVREWQNEARRKAARVTAPAAIRTTAREDERRRTAAKKGKK